MNKVTLSDGREITIREAKMKDVREAMQVDREIDQNFILISCLTGLSLQELDELTVNDFTLIQKYVGKSNTIKEK